MSRNAAKTLDEIKAYLGVSEIGDVHVMSHIKQMQHYRTHLQALANLICNPDWDENLPTDKIILLFGDGGSLDNLVKGDGNDVVLGRAIKDLRNLVTGYVSGYDGYMASWKDVRKDHDQLLDMICLALGLDPRKGVTQIPAALSQLTTALRILKSFTKDLNPASSTMSSYEEPTPPPEPCLMVVGENSGVYKISKEWYDWFWANYDDSERSACRIEERKAAMTKAITERVTEAILKDQESWPRGMNLVVTYPAGEEEMGIPTVLFAMDVGKQITQAFEGAL